MFLVHAKTKLSIWPLGCVRFAKYSVWSNVYRKEFIVGHILCRYLFPYAGYRAEQVKQLKILIKINFISSAFSICFLDVGGKVNT